MITFEPIKFLINNPGFSVFGFHTGNIIVPTWGLINVLTIVIATIYAGFEAKRRKLDIDEWAFTTILFIGSAIFGMRIFFFIVYGFTIQGIFERFFDLSLAGVASFGGFIAVPIVYLYLRKKKKLNFSQYFDTLVPSLALVIIGARLACLLVADHYGKATSLPWAFFYADVGKIVHPHALYVMFFGVGIFFAVNKIKLIPKYNKFDGQLFLIFLLIYAVMRFFTDFVREYHNYYYGFAITQYLSLGLILGCGYIYYKNINKVNNTVSSLEKQEKLKTHPVHSDE